MHEETPTWRRREFLACGAGGLAASFLIAPGGARAATAEPRLALAYLAGSDRPSDGTQQPLRLVQAAALDRGDAALAEHGAKLAIEGVVPEAQGPGRGLDRLGIELDYRPFHDNVVHLWRIDARPVLSVSPPVGVTLPVDATEGVSLTVALGAGGAESRTTLRFGVGAEPGLPKLRRGTYVLAWPEALGGPEPALAECRWGAQGCKGLSRFDRRQGAWRPAAFPYVTLSFALASEAIA